MSPSDSQIGNLNYEDALAELERIVNALENDQLALEQAMELFERGQNLVKRCEVLLEQADLRLQTLSNPLHETTSDEEIDP
jgi:exodeoxyribonuclease VII small subunit